MSDELLSSEDYEKVLCGLRVTQMTETYEDCAALTTLVQEQRSHLDLAANIGLGLVERNGKLEERVALLEGQLEVANETVEQMRRQLVLKDDLLQAFHLEAEIDENLVGSLGQQSLDSSHHLPGHTASTRHLETKVLRLEEENSRLREQQSNLSDNTDLLESKETQLVSDCVSHILESSKTIDRLSAELSRKTNDYLKQHEEVSRLLNSKVDLENKTHELLSENDRLVSQLRELQSKQFSATKAALDMKDRYDECIVLLNEKQDEIRRLKRQLDKESLKQIQFYGESLASELEQSDCHGGSVARIMERARQLNSTLQEDSDSVSVTSSSGVTEDLSSSCCLSVETEEAPSGNRLLRHSIQDDCERRRLLRLREGGATSLTVTRPSYPVLSDQVPISQTLSRFPDKLQLLKPIEGSQTLRAWQELARPSLSRALFAEPPSGVCCRGQEPPDNGEPESLDIRTPDDARRPDDQRGRSLWRQHDTPRLGPSAWLGSLVARLTTSGSRSPSLQLPSPLARDTASRPPPPEPSAQLD